MLPYSQRVAFLLFACLCLALGGRGFIRLWRRIQAGRPDTDARTNQPLRRAWYALRTTLSQSRTFRNRPVVSFFHSWIFYGFVFYLLVNLVDAIEGFYPLPIQMFGTVGRLYLLLADLLSALVLTAVLALIARRFLSPSRKDFLFNKRTLLHEEVRTGYIARDSLIVSAFILFHVGSRAMEMGANLAVEGSDRFQPFAGLLAHVVSPQHAYAVRVFGYWGALGSVLAFLAYFPYSKHIHIFLAPLKYAVARDVPSGVLPVVALDVDIEKETLGANKLEELAWPRLLDAYACIQCNRCQDVCPATATGKSLSPSALEINKRMELNALAKSGTQFETTRNSPRPLLTFALSPEAAWACTTCGACMQVCPVQDEPMLDIIDIRRQQVMMEGKFPAQLQSAFRGMERAKNPWGIAQENRLAWANGLGVQTVDENPGADVLYWVGCAASYDPQAQKTARALVQLLKHAEVNFAVLGKKECCTGDSARRAGNEFLYKELAEENVRTLNETAPKLIIATCPHCMNALGKEYPQLGGNYTVMHHTEFLDRLVQQGRLNIPTSPARTIAFHDPCYLGRHNDVYDAPRNLLHVLSNDVRELERSREKSFCCGAGGAQFWKEEEPGDEKISTNRLREAEQLLRQGEDTKVLAVGCPFCKSMLQSTPHSPEGTPLEIMDVAELLWANVSGQTTTHSVPESPSALLELIPSLAADAVASPVTTVDRVQVASPIQDPVAVSFGSCPIPSSPPRSKWKPKRSSTPIELLAEDGATSAAPDGNDLAIPSSKSEEKPAQETATDLRSQPTSGPANASKSAPPSGAAERAKWTPKRKQLPAEHAVSAAQSDPPKAIQPETTSAALPLPKDLEDASVPSSQPRKKWNPKTP